MNVEAPNARASRALEVGDGDCSHPDPALSVEGGDSRSGLKGRSHLPERCPGRGGRAGVHTGDPDPFESPRALLPRGGLVGQPRSEAERVAARRSGRRPRRRSPQRCICRMGCYPCRSRPSGANAPASGKVPLVESLQTSSSLGPCPLELLERVFGANPNLPPDGALRAFGNKALEPAPGRWCRGR